MSGLLNLLSLDDFQMDLDFGLTFEIIVPNN